MKGLTEELAGFSRVFVVYDRNAGDFARAVADEAAGVAGVRMIPVTADESHKTIETVTDICRALLECGADRDALLLAVGGGVTTDLAGFAACIYKRGIRYANVPTTLLAMVDAAIGGKTGCNLDSYKNLLGVICQPEFTAIFPEALRTLPLRELRSGYAELLKSFIIDNRSGAYDAAVALGSRLFNRDPRLRPALEGEVLDELSVLIREAGAVKQRIVEEDEFEHSVRRKLNLGHTWGHAIEWWQHSHGVADPCTHGEAVAIGMVQAARFAEKEGIAEEGLSARIESDLLACGLPVELPCPEEELLPAMRKDKKAEGGLVRLVLPVKVGEVTLENRKI